MMVQASSLGPNKHKRGRLHYLGGNGILELRITQSIHAARIFYFFTQGENIIITNGFIKKTQKTPKSELAKALAYKRDYQARNLL